MRIRRALAALVVALLASTGALAATPAPAAAAFAGPLVGPYRIYNTYSGLCIALTTDDWDPHTTLNMEYCSQETKQYFYLELTGISGVVAIEPALNLLCLDTWPYMFTYGSRITQEYCDIPIGSSPTQLWLAAIPAPGLVKFQNTYYAGPGYCIRSEYLTLLSPVVQGYCNDHNAIWALI